jgi:hypothetical protein
MIAKPKQYADVNLKMKLEYHDYENLEIQYGFFAFVEC